MTKKTYLPIIICGMTLLLLFPKEVHSEGSRGWYAGTWDSTIYNRAEKPRNVAIRFEIRDSDSDIPVPKVQITLQGYYREERVGKSGDDVGIPYEPQQKEFRLRAATNKDGVAVFALGWQKEYPWRSFFGDKAPEAYRKDGVRNSWIRAVDDIEKVQQIEFRHPRYNYKKIPFNFKHLLEFGQNKESQMQRPELFDKFEQAWQKEIKRKDVKFFALNLGTKFPDFQNKKSRRPEFFEKIHREDWGTVYQRPYNWFSKGEHPQSECGPYFAYSLDEVSIEKRTQEIEVTGIRSQEPGQDQVTTSQSEVELPGQEWKCPSCGHIYRGDAAPNFCPNCGKASTQVAGGEPSATESSGQGSQSLKAELAKLSKLSLPSLEEIRDDPTRLAELVKKGEAMKNNLAIAGIRVLPMMDPDTGQMTNLDAYARKLAQDKQLGGSLGEDPIATSYMMLFDSNFLVDEARIIKLQDGRYVSLTKALDVAVSNSDSGLDPEVLKRAVKTAADLHQASRLGKGQLMTKALTTLFFAVSENNALLNNVAAASMESTPKEANSTRSAEENTNDIQELSKFYWNFILGLKGIPAEELQKHIWNSRPDPAADLRLIRSSHMSHAEKLQGFKKKSGPIYGVLILNDYSERRGIINGFTRSIISLLEYSEFINRYIQYHWDGWTGSFRVEFDGKLKNSGKLEDDCSLIYPGRFSFDDRDSVRNSLGLYVNGGFVHADRIKKIVILHEYSEAP